MSNRPKRDFEPYNVASGNDQGGEKVCCNFTKKRLSITIKKIDRMGFLPCLVEHFSADPKLVLFEKKYALL